MRVLNLTRREYFAGLAMQGHFMLNVNTSPERLVAADFAAGSVAMADALIEELDKEFAHLQNQPEDGHE